MSYVHEYEIKYRAKADHDKREATRAKRRARQQGMD
jgi:hypothetical protein